MGLVNDMLEINYNLKIVNQLNKLLSLDPELTKKLVNTRYQVSQAYQESNEFIHLQDEPVAGLVGVLHGLVSINIEQFRIAARYDDNDQLIDFVLLEKQNNEFVEVK